MGRGFLTLAGAFALAVVVGLAVSLVFDDATPAKPAAAVAAATAPAPAPTYDTTGLAALLREAPVVRSVARRARPHVRAHRSVPARRPAPALIAAPAPAPAPVPTAAPAPAPVHVIATRPVARPAAPRHTAAPVVVDDSG